MNFFGIELLSNHCRNHNKNVEMANREELSHYNLDFAMETSKKVKQKEIKTITDEAKHLVSYIYLLSGCKVTVFGRNP